MGVSGPWGYPSEIEGSSFKLELRLDKIRIWLSGEDKPRVVKIGELQNARSQPDGSTNLSIRFKKDLIIPASEAESLRLVDALNALLNERMAVELRDKETAETVKRRLQKYSDYSEAG